MAMNMLRFRSYSFFRNRSTSVLPRMFERSGVTVVRLRFVGTTAGPKKPRSKLVKGLGIATRITFIGLIVPVACFGVSFAVAAQAQSREVEEAKAMEKVIEVDPHEIEVETTIEDMELVKTLRANPKFHELRPHKDQIVDLMTETLTAGALGGKGKISVAPYMWVNHDDRELVAVMHLGENLCGHPGIVHGGLLTIVMDEGLGGCAFTALPNQIGVTANLSMNFRNAAPPNNIYILRAKVTEAKGRKVWAAATFETAPTKERAGVVVCDATSLFIQPKWASLLPRIITTRNNV
ncbi:HotDog domain-containing protein [Lipomyces arxii]|uniref:HotDog domain-containing protein n=1 Tax=Lipomyces arxii TaxID=56418 RepID=UPI0034CEFBCF